MAYGVNAPFGLKPSRMLSGATWNGQTSEYLITSRTTSNLFIGDPVKPLAAGGVGLWTNGQLIAGVFMGCKYIDTNGNYVISRTWTNGTATYNDEPAIAMIVDDPNVLFDIQVSNSTNTISGIQLADLNINANLAVGGGGGNQVPQNPAAGSFTTGLSAYYLDYNTIAATATLPLKVLRLTPYPGNIFATGGPAVAGQGAYNNVLVFINNHMFQGISAGV